MDPNLVHLLKEVIAEAAENRGKVEIQFDAPKHIFVRVYSLRPGTETGSGRNIDRMQLLKEHTIYR